MGELVSDARCGVGESCVWDAARRRVLFCDIPAGRIHALNVDDGARAWWDFPESVGSFGLCRSGRLIVALRHRVVLFDPDDGAIVALTQPVDEPATNRFNDGKVGPDGAFWVGSMDQWPHSQPTGHLYRVTGDGRIERRSSGYIISNGLAWSPDGRTMYHADTLGPYVDAWDFDPATGGTGNRRRFADLTLEQGYPDGAAMDEHGNYWSAGVTAGRLNRFTPDGVLAESVRFPVPTPTMPCFADGWLYGTSMRDGVSEDTLADFPDTGGLFRLPVAVRGAPISLFADGGFA
jgi:sugar lactone lactonase YvrE